MKNILNYELKTNNDLSLEVPASTVRSWIKQNKDLVAKRAFNTVFHYFLEHQEEKLSQDDIAQSIGVSRVYLNNALHGRKTFSPDLLKRLADFLGVSMFYFLGFFDNEDIKENEEIDKISALKIYTAALGIETDKNGNVFFSDSWGNKYPVSASQYDLLLERIDRAARFLIDETFFPE